MNRTILMVAGVFGASSLLVVDAAVKGTALLVLAASAALVLRRDSAATRHLVWLLALVALLVVPVLSALLPEWRVLPEWAGIPPEPVAVDKTPPSSARPADEAVALPDNAAPGDIDRPAAAAHHPAALPASRPAPVTPAAMPAPAVGSWNWIKALPLVWALGFAVLILRLMAARWLLWNTERRGTVLGSSRQVAQVTHDPLVKALEAACLQLGIGRPITLLIHPDRTIPVVWGLLRCRLLLPAAARQWSGEQLRSVLLHELAHVKRRDTMVQLLAQIACALHWFNPLVWFAAWRLGVERERACDDLVLASGVRPSAYAGHLLDVVTGLAPPRWTQSCGLAMARRSSFESRLVAVLSKSLNRRGVSVALAVGALAIAVGIAVPIAMLRAADERSGVSVKQEPQKPKGGAKLKPGMEKKLKWGKPVNGLRAALAIRNSTDEPKAGDRPELYLVVQNVSDAPIRLSDTNVPPNVDLRVLYLKIEGDMKMGLGARVPALGDLMLQPREAAFLLMFLRDSKTVDGHTIGSFMAEAALKDTHQTLVAHLRIEKAPAGAWTGKLVTGETSGSVAAGQPQPKDNEAKALYKVWQHNARKNGNIPGGFIGRLGEKVNEFIRVNSADVAGAPYAKKMKPLASRFSAARDWTLAEAVALLDDIAAVSSAPLHTALDEAEGVTFKRGAPLPKDLATAPWGEALPNGLRMAWLLEPRAAEHRLGTPLKACILIHNAGKEIVVFRTRLWHQVGHTARDAKGADIHVEATNWLTRGQLRPFRLWPGEFVEVNAPGIGVGPMGNSEDWQNTGVGSWIEAKAGDDVTVTTSPVPLSDWNEKPPLNGEPRWWLDLITARLARELPMPADADERSHLVYRAGMDLFGTPLAADEIAAFVSDHEPSALDSLAKRLAKRPGLTPFSGALTSGTTTFRVLPADPDAAKKPRTASNPGHYTLAENANLVVSRRPVGERIVNEASLHFSSPDPTRPAAAEPHKLKLPDGYNTWAAAWVRGTTVLWVLQKGNVRRYDFTNPAQVKETTLQAANLAKVPRPILDALRAALDLPSAVQPATETPKKESQR